MEQTESRKKPRIAWGAVVRCALLAAALGGAGACRRDKAPRDLVADAGAVASSAAPRSHVSCARDGRVSAFAPNVEKATQRGTFKVRLVSAEPAPPAKGLNAWTVRVLSASGAPVSTASLALHRESDSPDPSMPDHGHGSLASAAVERRSNGDFAVEPLDLFMPGVWRVGFDVSAPNQPSDTVFFFFCIPG
jgi:hypothetical protein